MKSLVLVYYYEIRNILSKIIIEKQGENQLDLYYNIQGNGKPIIFLHSGAMDSQDWCFIAPKIASYSYQVITLDLRGAGESPFPTEPMDYVQDLRKVYDELDIKEAVLVGHSLGGQIATDFTLTYPDKVSQLILIAPGLSGFEFSSEYQEWYKKIVSAIPDVEKMIDITLSEASWSIPKGATYNLLREIMSRNIQRTFTPNIQEVVAYSAIKRLHEMKAKTLLLIGENESQDVLNIATHYKVVPNIQIQRISDANHIITLTHPEEITNEIISFLK